MFRSVGRSRAACGFRPGCSSCFPSTSVTGAPKWRRGAVTNLLLKDRLKSSFSGHHRTQNARLYAGDSPITSCTHAIGHIAPTDFRLLDRRQSGFTAREISAGKPSTNPLPRLHTGRIGAAYSEQTRHADPQDKWITWRTKCRKTRRNSTILSFGIHFSIFSSQQSRLADLGGATSIICVARAILLFTLRRNRVFTGYTACVVGELRTRGIRHARVSKIDRPVIGAC